MRLTEKVYWIIKSTKVWRVASSMKFTSWILMMVSDFCASSFSLANFTSSILFLKASSVTSQLVLKLEATWARIPLTTVLKKWKVITLAGLAKFYRARHWLIEPEPLQWRADRSPVIVLTSDEKIQPAAGQPWWGSAGWAWSSPTPRWDGQLGSGGLSWSWSRSSWRSDSSLLFPSQLHRSGGREVRWKWRHLGKFNRLSLERAPLYGIIIDF